MPGGRFNPGMAADWVLSPRHYSFAVSGERRLLSTLTVGERHLFLSVDKHASSVTDHTPKNDHSLP
jgi:hypothetical protein